MSTRGDRTRAAILDVAEPLFAERGIADVSLREIRIAAGQRNSTALQYHFGSRAGLVEAIMQRHLPPLEARESELYRELQQQPDADLRSHLGVLVRPSAEYIGAGPSARAWLQISAQLLANPKLPISELEKTASTTSAGVGNAIVDLLSHDVPRDFAGERLIAVCQSAAYTIADRARLEEAASRRVRRPLDLFIANLLDMSTAALTAPLSEQTRTMLTEQSDPTRR